MIISIDAESVRIKNSGSHCEKIRNKVRVEKLSPLLLTIVLKKLPGSMRQEKNFKQILQNGREEEKLFLCRWHEHFERKSYGN